MKLYFGTSSPREERRSKSKYKFENASVDLLYLNLYVHEKINLIYGL